MSKRRWTGWDCIQMRQKCKQFLGMDGLEIMENPQWVLLLNNPPLSISKLVEVMEMRHKEYMETDLTLKELIVKQYGEDAFRFVLEYSGGSAKRAVLRMSWH